jgi:hypothetical protein
MLKIKLKTYVNLSKGLKFKLTIQPYSGTRFEDKVY